MRNARDDPQRLRVGRVIECMLDCYRSIAMMLPGSCRGIGITRKDATELVPSGVVLVRVSVALHSLRLGGTAGFSAARRKRGDLDAIEPGSGALAAEHENPVSPLHRLQRDDLRSGRVRSICLRPETG